MIDKKLETAYQQMAQEEAREAEALEWAEAVVKDVDESACTGVNGFGLRNVFCY